MEIILGGISMWCLYPLLTGDAFEKDSGYSSARFVIGGATLVLAIMNI